MYILVRSGIRFIIDKEDFDKIKNYKFHILRPAIGYNYVSANKAAIEYYKEFARINVL